ncbi:MAG: AhpC/TSA family protein [Bacteroidetes bacterium]|nr:MAG: AhpC/TSA family protein [Bacteroidota bacterium]
MALAFMALACGDSKKKQSENQAVKQEHFVIEGKIENGVGNIVLLGKIGLKDVKIVASDTADREGNFRLEGYAREKFVAILNFQDYKKIYLVVDTASQMKLAIPDLNYDDYVLEGSEESQEFRKLRNIEVRSGMALEGLRKEATGLEPDDARLERLRVRYADTLNKYQTEMVEGLGNTNSILTQLFFMYTQDDLEFNDSFKKVLYENCVASGLENEFVQRFMYSTRAEMATAVGNNAPEIALMDTNGQVVSLSSLRGKVVLIDFWASWCKPCRMENPNVVRMYKKYKDQGFEIFGVSLDNSAGPWKKAILADEIFWTHVSDLKGWQSSAAKLYAVESIPATFVIDREGKIAAKGLRGEKLEEKVAELLSNSH